MKSLGIYQIQNEGKEKQENYESIHCKVIIFILSTAATTCAVCLFYYSIDSLDVYIDTI